MILKLTNKLTILLSLFSFYFQIVQAQDINQILGSLPPGKTLVVTYKVFVDTPFAVSSVSNQAEISGSSFSTILTDDPDIGGSANPTVTLISDIPIPIELFSFTANVNRDNVELLWKTATEVNNYGFEVERAIRSNEVGGKTFQMIGFVPGSGNSNSPKTYSFTDKKLLSGKYTYRLKQIDSDGSYEYFSEIEVEVRLGVHEYSLLQNYPNPFNPSTKIEYTLPFDSHVKLKIYNMIGEQVATLVDEVKPPGYNEAIWNAGNIPSGIYLYSLETMSIDGGDNFKSVRKMILIK